MLSLQTSLYTFGIKLSLVQCVKLAHGVLENKYSRRNVEIGVGFVLCVSVIVPLAACEPLVPYGETVLYFP